MKKTLLTLAALCAACAVFAQSEILKLNLREGDVFNKRANVVSKIGQNLFGQQINIDSETTGEVRYEVVGVEDGNYVMEAVYTRLSMSMTSPALPVDMSGSSDSPGEDDMFSQLLGAMTGKPFLITMSPSGRVVGVEGIEKLYEGLSGVEALSSLPPESAQQIVEQVKASYGSDAFKSNMESGGAVFPETPVSVGDSWTNEATAGGSMKIGIKVKYTLAAKTPDGIFINAEAEIAMDGGEIDMSGMSALCDFDGSMVSEMRLNPRTLWTESSENTVKMSGSVTVPKSEQVPMDMTIPMTTETVSSYESF